MEIFFHSEETEKHYRKHRYTEIPFDSGTKYALGLIERDIYLIYRKNRWSCRIKKAGMSGAKVLVSLSGKDITRLESAGEISLNFSFIGYNSFLIPISLSIPYIIEDIELTRPEEEGTYLVSLSNKHKPPDYLIGMFADFIESIEKESKRKEQRISINEISRSVLGLKSKKARFTINGKRYTCCIEDLSLSGAGITLPHPIDPDPGEVNLELVLLDPDMILEIPAFVVKYHASPSGEEVFDLGVRFAASTVPPEYKKRIRRILVKE
ncbi:MAG: PilZN3 domain-containing protein [Spirochaetia bacterium]